ncbi:MAG: ParB N-terminal domain-containing protein [Candidatus Eremiobacteraeota bacterium]|nr:ParB N-terminal domain-containing protein [Candidatus Eremiobacteraeota bacterium]
MQNTKLSVEYISTNSIIPYTNNPRIHKNKQVRQIVDSIKEFNFNNPILIDENSVIIAGHGRLLAAQHLNLQQVPVIKLTHLTEGEKKAYRIADNKLTENGEWDVDLLKLELVEIEKLELDFSLDITGFDTADIDLMLDNSLGDKEIKLDEKANAVPFIPENEVITKIGWIWQLGKHRVICGNAIEKEYYSHLFADKKADMVFTDPPYNVRVQGHICGNGKVKHSEFKMASGEMSAEEFQEFLSSNFTHLKEFSKNGSLVFICMDWRHIKEIINAGTDVFDELKNLCVWNKDNGGMGSLYRSKHELVFVFKNGKRPHKNNVELGSHGRYRTNVWDYPGVNSFSGDKDKLKMHPTVKPVEMIRDAILDVTNRGSIVLDSFLGSGSTLIAAEQAGRICCGIELEPLYVDTTIRRWQELTGKPAIHLETGKTYRELMEILLSGKPLS